MTFTQNEVIPSIYMIHKFEILDDMPYAGGEVQGLKLPLYRLFYYNLPFHR